MNVPFLDLRRQHAALRETILGALADTYDHCRFALGADVEQFEERLAGRCGTPGAVGVNSGTSALHLVMHALDLGPGDEVILPPFTFAATAWGVSYVGARPVFADIERGSMNLDPAAVRAALTPATRAILAVHLFGRPAAMDELAEIAARHGLALVEDAAQAIGATHGGRPVGGLGDAATFSFYPTKNLAACGEAGAVTSPRRGLLDRVRLLRVHGSPRRYHHVEVGYNYRMEGFQGAVLREKLAHLDRWNARRRAIAARYREGLRLRDALLPEDAPDGGAVWHQFTLRHPRRDDLRAHLTRIGIGCDIIYPEPLHLQPCYAHLGHRPGSFPVAEEAARTCLSLPIFPELTDDEVEAVIAGVNTLE